MDTLFEGLTASHAMLLAIAVGVALAFEFVNGFHDTANAVATVIYTRSLRPTLAVLWSGVWNLIGVLVSSGAVAFAVIAILPVELMLDAGSGAGFAMIFALLLSAILWNVGTWYLGLPASSSHTLIGSIIGVGLANSWLRDAHQFGQGVNWHEVAKVFTALLVSPLTGYLCAFAGLLLLQRLARNPALYLPPPGEQPPPGWIRGILMLTCTGVSFAHGSNDGQKGMGLILLILIGLMPHVYALNPGLGKTDLAGLLAAGTVVQRSLAAADASLTPQAAADQVSAFLRSGPDEKPPLAALSVLNAGILANLGGAGEIRRLSAEQASEVRRHVYLLASAMKHAGAIAGLDAATLRDYRSRLDGLTNFLPLWVKIAVAVALGCGTMVGWRRIVVTVGERIGRDHLTYGQGMVAESVTMLTILAADIGGAPVSTTHVLSSGIAGAMSANRSGLQAATVRNIILAWVLTLPVCVLLGSTLFAAGLALMLVMGISGG